MSDKNMPVVILLVLCGFIIGFISGYITNVDRQVERELRFRIENIIHEKDVNYPQ